MKRICIAFVLVNCVFFLSGCEKGSEHTIIVKNETGKDITLLSFSEHIKSETPIVIRPHTQKELFTDIVASGIDMVFLYNEKKYGINTGYADDYRQFTLRFSESETAPYGIHCFFVVNGAFSSSLESPREIEEIE